MRIQDVLMSAGLIVLLSTGSVMAMDASMDPAALDALLRKHHIMQHIKTNVANVEEADQEYRPEAVKQLLSVIGATLEPVQREQKALEEQLRRDEQTKAELATIKGALERLATQYGGSIVENSVAGAAAHS